MAHIFGLKNTAFVLWNPHQYQSRAADCRGSEVHNELLHDESVAFGADVKFPESDHAPVRPPGSN